MKRELNAGRKEVEQMLKSEAAARGRVEENEEALRESTLALENARAEIEVLRSEIVVSIFVWGDSSPKLMTLLEKNLDSLAASDSAQDTPQKLTDSVSRATGERFRLAQEVAECGLAPVSRCQLREGLQQPVYQGAALQCPRA